MYVLLFGVPALFASVMISVLALGAAAGALWLFFLGDGPWPSTAGSLLMAMFVLVCMALWVALISVAYLVGKKQEAHAVLNAKHVAASVGATLLLALLVLLHQWGVGNIGRPSDGALCSEFCRAKGFAGSGMPPRNTGATTCSCFDVQGREAATIPIENIATEQRK